MHKKAEIYMLNLTSMRAYSEDSACKYNTASSMNVCRTSVGRGWEDTEEHTVGLNGYVRVSIDVIPCQLWGELWLNTSVQKWDVKCESTSQYLEYGWIWFYLYVAYEGLAISSGGSSMRLGGAEGLTHGWKILCLHFWFIQRGSRGIFVLCTRCTRIDAAERHVQYQLLFRNCH